MCELRIKSIEEVGSDAEALGLLQACVARMAQYNRLRDAEIYVNARDAKGWLEFGMQMWFEDGGRLFVGALQRNTGMQFEFHS